MTHILNLLDLETEQIHEIFQRAADLKSFLSQGIREPICQGSVVALLFEKPSLRTRVSFETAITHLGGNCMYLGSDVGWGEREAPQDFARVLGSYVDIIVCRAYRHSKIQQLAASSPAAVINGLTDSFHPCQALTDLFTLKECQGHLAGLVLAYVGDSNNVSNSLAIACAKLGVEFRLACPDRYQMSDEFVADVQREIPDARIVRTESPVTAVKGASCVYTDVWTSMGHEAERAERLAAFDGYQVNAELLAYALPNAIFLHCLPAQRGVEVSEEILDGPQSQVFRQAENRMHLQKGLLAWILDSRN